MNRQDIHEHPEQQKTEKQDERQQRRQSPNSNSKTQLLQIGVVLLSIVSFFTTANGMKTYIFIDNGVIAYAASAAIQGILLALSLNLPSYLRDICAQPGQEPSKSLEPWLYLSLLAARKIGRFLKKSLLCAAALLLTIVTIFCSSWFSYIYIADVIHRGSWDVDSELLVQQSYRSTLYSAQDYAHTYRTYLEGALGEHILLLEEQASEFENQQSELELDWMEERNKYALADDSTASNYMSIVIQGMEKAMKPASSAEDRNLAVRAISDAKTNIGNRMESLQQDINNLATNIASYNSQINSLQTQLARAEEGTDTTPIANLINTNLQLVDQAVEQQEKLQTEYLALERASGRLLVYESILGLSSSTSQISIRNDLIRLQEEFFKQEPDAELLLEIAGSIFSDMRSAARTNTDSDSSSTSYTTQLIQMNQLYRRLTDYVSIKEIESNLDQLVWELHEEENGSAPEDKTPGAEDLSSDTGVSGDPTQTDTPSEGQEPGNPDGTAAPEGQEPGNPDGTAAAPEGQAPEPPAGTAAPEGQEPGNPDGTTSSEGQAPGNPDGSNTPSKESGAANSEKGESQSNENDDSQAADDQQWKEAWRTKLDDLKAQIGALPVYSATEETGSDFYVLSESQENLLRSYDRDQASRELDDMIRRYLSERNAVYQGLIYLESPYRSLALFALVLALSFDLSGFVFGVVVPNNDAEKDSEESSTDSQKNSKDSSKNKGDKTSGSETAPSGSDPQENEWSVLETLTPYFVLTGDYEKRDGNFYYTAFRDGRLCQWAVKDTKLYSQGIYIQTAVDDGWSKGDPISSARQDLLFALQQDGPKDGVYRDCRFLYDDGSLLLVHDKAKSYLCSIDEYVPVHRYDPNRGENITIPAKQLAANDPVAEVAVAALNSKGTRVAAIYIIDRIIDQH